MSTPTERKSLRFANLIRVSTERQEKQGESLHTQRKYNRRDVERMGGTVAEEYGGQEHGTPGWEKKEVDRLLSDAARGKFDAVIITYADRWSRDNAKSKEGLQLFRDHGIRFFIGSVEQNLFDPQVRLNLGLHAEIGEFIALQASKKSLETRIERALRGMPSCGRLPFGRAFDPDAPQTPAAGRKHLQGWSLIPADVERIEAIADRLLKAKRGDKTATLNRLAEEFGMSSSGLSKVLNTLCGDTWKQEFCSKGLNIHDHIDTPVPRILPEETIKKVKTRLTEHRTRTTYGGRPRHEYVLRNFVFCAGCGTTLTGDTDCGTRFYYHARSRNTRAARCCVRPRPRVPAAELEANVVSELFNTFGNAAALERAIKAAVPDCAKEEVRRDKLKADLKKIEQARGRLVDAVADGTFTKEQVKAKQDALNEREGSVREQLAGVEEKLADVPDADQVRKFVENFGTEQDPAIIVYDSEGNTYAGGNDVASYAVMGGQDKRVLIESVFSTPVGGAPSGVYISRTGDEYAYELRGRFVRVGTVFARSPRRG